MSRKRLNPGLVLLFGLGLMMNLHAQEAIPVSGGNASGTGGSVSYTVGQLFYSIHTGTNGSVAEGVQQPYEISVVVGIEQDMDITLLCMAYPNPTADLLTLEVEHTNKEKLFFQIYDLTGKLLVSKRLVDTRTTISMAHLAPSTYILKVRNEQRVVKIFKIIKNP
jgi:hypothetical protein